MSAPLDVIPGGASAAGAAVAVGREGRAPGLLEKLMAAVRPEFRSAVLVFDSADPVFGAAPCAVADCGYPGRTRGLCTAHNQRWVHAGRPELAEFIARVSPHRKGHAPFKQCRAPGCGFGISRTGLCQRHDGAWRRAGQPDQAAWLARYPIRAEPEHELCPAVECGLWTQGSMPLCLGHAARWRGLGRPPLEQLLAELAAPEQVTTEPIDLAILKVPLRLEIQYALQCRSDEKGTKVIPACARAVASFLAREQARSLLERTETQWREAWAACFRQTRITGSGKLPLLIYARRQVELLAFGSGWESEYERDVWRLSHLGSKIGRRNVRFDKIPQPWFKELAKRRVRLQLAAGRSPGHAINTARAASVFALFLDEIEVTEISQITRQVLERFLAHLSGLGHSPSHTGALIGSLSGLLTEVRRHGWDTALPPDAVFYPEDFPIRPVLLPRALPEHVIAQLEDPANLARFRDPVFELVTLILIRTGLRISDALALPGNCLAYDANNAPYLRYVNHKMKREALVPIDEQLEKLIAAQRETVREAYQGSSPLLFPRPVANIDGTRRRISGTYQNALDAWLKDCEIRDRSGAPMHVTAHQFRHSLGTTLINKDVPQEVVRKILDHDSHAMTAHYARLSDETVRRHWETARKVNAQGENVQLDPAGPLADAAWSNQRLSRATQALPNGYCALPLVQTCPHANACLTCPMFLTTARFLPQHREQRTQTLQIISKAEAAGHSRQAEMNRQVAANLDRIISALETDENEGNTRAS